jgi:hypothetical protein
MWGTLSDERTGPSITTASLVSEINLGSESRGTHDHILLFKIRYFANLEGQAPAFLYFYHPGTRRPSYPPGTEFASHHLQRYC